MKIYGSQTHNKTEESDFGSDNSVIELTRARF